MTEAEKLLQETKSAVVAETQTEDICVIDSDLRIIDIPEQFKVLGVENDKDVKVMQFRMPKVYKGTDLSAFNISVNYQNARGTKDRYVVADKKVSGDQIEFSWTVGKTATVYRGDTRFIVCMRLIGSDGVIKKEFNTTLATMTVLEGLEVDNPVIEQEEKDIIAQLLQIVDDKSKEAVQAVTAEGTKQIKAVQAEAQEIAADREQIKTNKADIADLMQTKAGAIINSAKGERIAVGDSAGAFFEGLKLYGKTEQVHTKGYQLFDASKIATKSAGGATVANNGDGSFTISGSGNLTSAYNYSYVSTHEEMIKLLKVGKLYHAKSSITGPQFVVAIYNMQTSQIVKSLYAIEQTRSMDITSEDLENENYVLNYRFIGTSGDAIKPGTVKPMIYQDGDGTWEPFTGGKPSPSMEYKQDPSSSGDSGSIGLEVFGKNLLQKNKIKRLQDNVYLFNDSKGFLMKKGVSYALSLQNVVNAIYLIPMGKNASDAIKKVTGDNKLTFTATEDINVYFNIYIPGAAESVTNIQLEYAKNPTDYEEPKEVRSTSLSTPNGLPGLPVDSGGNYTDSNGQQWICDEMDFKRGKYVQRVKEAVFDGSEDEVWRREFSYVCILIKDSAPLTIPLVNKFVGVKNTNSNANTNNFSTISSSSALTCCLTGITDGELQVWTTYLQTNPIEVLYILSTPIETDIPEETMTAYRNLCTNYPSTVIQNDSGAGMEVEYVADTKSYIDNKLKELVQA